MLLIYRFLINIILILSPLIIIFRILKKKESLKRFKEKLCLPTRKRNKGNASRPLYMITLTQPDKIVLR